MSAPGSQEAVHEALVGAYNLIDDEGWVQRAGRRRPRLFGLIPGGYCISGAIGRVVMHDQATYLAATAAWRDANPGKSGPMAFNDARGRKKWQVLASLAAAIALTAPEPALELPALALAP
jgi:hypothetical protein